MRPAFARFELPPALDTEPLASWPLAATAQHVVLSHLRRLLSLRDAAWNGDADAIRRLRVAARRARTALGDFAALWDQDTVRAARRALRRLADRLGQGRDLDVVLALVEAATSAGRDAPALAAARDALHRRRASAQTDVRDGLRVFEHDGWPTRLLTYFASQPLDLWRYVDVQEILHNGEGTHDR